MLLFYSWYTYIIILPGLLLAIYASAKVNSTFNKYSQIMCKSGYLSNHAAEKLLENNGCRGVAVVKISGRLTDNYNPQTNTLNLSESVYGKSSISAVGVAAHECGHAIQDSEEYLPMKLRKVLVPITNFGTRLAIPLCLFGILLEYLTTAGNAFSEILVFAGILCYGLATLFSLITLPVELDASRRATKLLVSEGIIDNSEKRQVRQVLNAAALTYFANLLISLLYFLRFLLILSNLRRR